MTQLTIANEESIDFIFRVIYLMKWWSDPTATFDMLVLVERQFQALDGDWLVRATVAGKLDTTFILLNNQYYL